MRLFIALEMPPAVTEHCAGVLAQLRHCGADVKWVRPQAIHLTLKFLGEAAPTAVAAIQQALDQAAGAAAPLDLAVGGAGRFPAQGPVKVVWLGLRGDLDPLAELAADLDRRLALVGFAPEGRPFRPHLTLGRVKDSRGAGGLKREIAALAEPGGPAFTARHASLIQSQLSPSGARHTVLYQAALGAAHAQGL